jgi:asparagine synthase (glutamine-hydrolysing)
VTFTIEVNLGNASVRADAPLDREDGLLIAFSGFLAHDDGRPPARVVSAWRREGLTFSHDLLGQYAGVLVDPRSRRVTLFQDALGLRTLYFTIRGDRLVVSTELRRLLHAVPDELDEDYFARLLCRGYPSPARTPFLAISKLACGVNVEFAGTARRDSPPWIPAHWTPFAGDPDQALRDHLDEAVAAIAPAGREQVLCELSGGLDSSTVTATLAAAGASPTALTYVSSMGLLGEDEQHAAALVQKLDLAWRRLDFDLYPRFSLSPDRFLGEPGDEPHQAIQRAYRQIVEAVGASVILTGVGGDVILGYGGMRPMHLADDLARGRLAKAIGTAKTWSRGIDRHRPWTHFLARFGAMTALRYALGRSMETPRDPKLPGWLTEDLVRKYRTQRQENVVPRGGAPSRQYLWDAVFSMSATQASSPFRSGLPAQTRHPLLHRPLVEFMIGLDWRLRGGCGREETNRDRVLQRRALADRLPSGILSRATKGSDQPLSETVLLRSGAFFQALLDQSRLVQRGWVDKDLWAGQIARAGFGVFDGLPNFDAAVTCEMWLRTLELPREDFPDLEAVPALEAS